MRPPRRVFSSQLSLVVLAVGIGLVLLAAITLRLFGSSLDALRDTPDYASVVLVNGLIALSVVLFIVELRFDALRVVLTVIVALVFGYFVTAMFNLDAARRFERGEFRVTLDSDAAPVAAEDLELEYGKARGGEFNKEDAVEPLTKAEYRFGGHAGDAVTLLAYVTRANIELDLELALLGPDGTRLAESIDATEEQVAAFPRDLKSTKDAAIENFTLPADGTYTVVVEPEPISNGLVMSEMFAKTRQAYDAFLLGPLNRVNRWATWIQDALTLILLGLSIAIVFRAQQFSLGADGQLYFGALVSGALVLAGGNVPKVLMVPIALASAMTAGFLWGLLPGALKAYLGANELVSTLMLNEVATRFYELVLTWQLQPPDAGYTASDNFPASGQLPPIIANTQVTIAVYIVLITVVLTWLLIRRTPIGYEIRMIGSNIKFANYGGINTKRTIMLAMALSGAVAGLAGAHLAMGIHRRLILNISIGLGFEGVVVALLARNNPLVVPFTGLLYAYLRTGARYMESDANVSFEVVRIIQAVIILLITADALVSYFQRRRVQRRGAAPEVPPPTRLMDTPPHPPTEEASHAG